ncbi:GNAT family N-acetyltransferase [Enterovibrio baiacu]|uniref:GNAT family N-acetyltransferase n=1 Tax=Enterovibrio baiacu TaxID=2491023 RepID=UPI001010384C|nr:GNAT family N-acetyltransferase [Enterovibrio baiacu]MBE1275575.1 N-acetyltransferase [Enterovibrio baiacu]
MHPVTLSPLSMDDCDALLDFECRNKGWFEQHIPPRPSRYFDRVGLTAATQKLVQTQGDESHLMYVVYQGTEIVARANIHTIRPDFVEIGYRVCQSHIGKGIATQAVAALLTICRRQLATPYVLAKVTTENHASHVVLKKTGFTLTRKEKNGTVVKGKHLSLCHYEYHFE